MTSTRLVDQGDSLWLVWREGKRAQLYPCSVDSIVRSSPEATVVRLSFLQDNGMYQEPSEILIVKIDPSKSIVLSRSLDPPSILKIPEVQSMLLVPVTLNLCPRLSQYLTLYIDVSVESRVV